MELKLGLKSVSNEINLLCNYFVCFQIGNCFSPEKCEETSSFEAAFNTFHELNIDFDYEFDLTFELGKNSQKLVQINVWGDDDESNKDQLNNFVDEINKLDLSEGKDLLVIFNGEIRKRRDDFVLVVPSEQHQHHHGRTVKIVNRNSILGKKFMEKIESKKTAS